VALSIIAYIIAALFLFITLRFRVPPKSNRQERTLATYVAQTISKNLVVQGFVHSFNALETTQVIYAKPGAQTWNQIHVIGFKPLNLLRIIPTYDQALQEVTPDGKGFDDVVAHLNEICENTRVDLAHELALNTKQAENVFRLLLTNLINLD
jgi:hypothetical protein